MALVWFFAIVLPEVVLDVAALPEALVAPVHLADEEQFVLLGLLVVELINLVPFFRNSLETPVLTSLCVHFTWLALLLFLRWAGGAHVGGDGVQIQGGLVVSWARASSNLSSVVIER